jgi:hypothetical protein
VKHKCAILVACSLWLPAAAGAQGGDKAYCAQLSDLYRRYIQNAPGHRFDVDASLALENCQKGNTAAAIPVLEKRLREGGFSLPEEFKP